VEGGRQEERRMAGCCCLLTARGGEEGRRTVSRAACLPTTAHTGGCDSTAGWLAPSSWGGWQRQQ
jgi:hypothetical protein